MSTASMLITPRYRLVAPIGEGSMGVVVQAYDRLADRDVALKQVLLPPELTPEETEQELLTLAHEFRTLAGLRHPHIISVLDYGFDHERRPFFTMELLENAATILDAARLLPLTDKLTLLLQAAEALAYLHRRGVLHHDLKPANVLVAAGRVRLLDFGLAVLADQQRESDTFGTILYLAPEVIDDQPYTEQADLYSLGLLAYELLVGRFPFNTTAIRDFLQQVTTQSPDLSALADQPALAAILAQLLAKTPAERPRSAQATITLLRTAAGLPELTADAAIRESYLQAATFVGREAELAQLSAILDAAHQGQGSAWLVGGESGVGKSRLLDELRTQALVDGFQVLRAQAVEGGGLPYQIWREPLRALLATTEVTDQLTAGVLLPLVPDLPQLLGRTVAPAPELAAEAAQLRLHSTIAQLFATTNQPLLLLLEDLHWAEESLLPLPYLLRQTHKLPLVVIGSFRDDERPELPERLAGMELLTLNRLSSEELATLSSAMLGEAGRLPELQQLLQRETEGNAFFAVEVVRALAEQAGDLEQIRSISLPQSVMAGGVRGVIARRLNRVPAELQGLLGLMAVAGREVELDLLSHLAGNWATAERWLAACADATVIALQDEQWQFQHAKLREGALAEIPPATLPDLQRRVAEGLVALHADEPDQAARIAGHWQAAGDEARELHYTLRAARHATAQYANQSALQHFERALALVPADDLAQRYIVLLEHYQILNLLGVRAAQLEALDALDALATALDSPERKVEVAHTRALLCVLGKSDAEATALCAEAVRLAELLGQPRWLARALSLQAYLYVDQRKLELALEILARAEQIAKQADLPEHETRNLNTKNLILSRLGRAQEAQVVTEQAIAEHRRNRRNDQLQAELNNAAVNALFAGDFEQFRAYSDETLALAQAIGNIYGEMITLANYGYGLVKFGAYSTALECLTQALTLAERLDARHMQTSVLNNLGDAYHRLGDTTQAERYYHETIQLRRTIGFSWGEAYTWNLLGHLFSERGAFDAAEAAYRQAETILQPMSAGHTLTETWCGLAACALQREDRAAAQTYASQALDFLDANGFDAEWQWALGSLKLFMTLRTLGDPRADAVLARAHAKLQTSAATIGDPALREQFLSITEHRTILGLMAQR